MMNQYTLEFLLKHSAKVYRTILERALPDNQTNNNLVREFIPMVVLNENKLKSSPVDQYELFKLTHQTLNLKNINKLPPEYLTLVRTLLVSPGNATFPLVHSGYWRFVQNKKQEWVKRKPTYPNLHQGVELHLPYHVDNNIDGDFSRPLWEEARIFPFSRE